MANSIPSVTSRKDGILQRFPYCFAIFKASGLKALTSGWLQAHQLELHGGGERPEQCNQRQGTLPMTSKYSTHLARLRVLGRKETSDLISLN